MQVSVDSLTAAQRAFAASVGAAPVGVPATERDAVYLYRDDPNPERWLVSAEGQVLDHRRFA